MEIYNKLIRETTELLQGGHESWAYVENEAWKSLGSSELVLQRDAAFELGAHGKGSANYILFTSDPALVNEDKVLLFGPDLGEISGDCDFARIVLLRTGYIDDDEEKVYRTLKDIEFAKYHVYPEGYMVRISPGAAREQVRVSREAVRRGISFKAVGANYIEEYKKNPYVLAATVIFVTDPGFEYGWLQELAKKSAKLTSTLTHILEGLPNDCSICALKEVCDEVEGMKELHFGVSSGKN